MCLSYRFALCTIPIVIIHRYYSTLIEPSVRTWADLFLLTTAKGNIKERHLFVPSERKFTPKGSKYGPKRPKQAPLPYFHRSKQHKTSLSSSQWKSWPKKLSFQFFTSAPFFTPFPNVSKLVLHLQSLDRQFFACGCCLILSSRRSRLRKGSRLRVVFCLSWSPTTVKFCTEGDPEYCSSDEKALI